MQVDFFITVPIFFLIENMTKYLLCYKEFCSITVYDYPFKFILKVNIQIKRDIPTSHMRSSTPLNVYFVGEIARLRIVAFLHPNRHYLLCFLASSSALCSLSHHKHDALLAQCTRTLSSI